MPTTIYLDATAGETELRKALATVANGVEQLSLRRMLTSLSARRFTLRSEQATLP